MTQQTGTDPLTDPGQLKITLDGGEIPTTEEIVDGEPLVFAVVANRDDPVNPVMAELIRLITKGHNLSVVTSKDSWAINDPDAPVGLVANYVLSRIRKIKREAS